MAGVGSPAVMVWPNLTAQLGLVGGCPHYLYPAEYPEQSFWLLLVFITHEVPSV